MEARKLRIIKPGPFATVQDLGRKGFQRFGVPASGAADPYALKVANKLVGNPDGTAAIEFTLGGLEVEFLCEASFAVSGADVPITLDGISLEPRRNHQVRAGSVMKAGMAEHGVRAYLAVAGGIDVPEVLGSRSTYSKAGLGGFNGRALMKDDVIDLGKQGQVRADCVLVEGFKLPSLEKDTGNVCVLRVTPGTMDTRFVKGALDKMLEETYLVGPDSDRMGIRLKGKTVSHAEGADILSSGIEPGAVQVPGSGEPIALGADRQTTGGYVKAFAIIAADRPKLGQLRPGEKVRFSMVSINEAAEAYENRLSDLEGAVTVRQGAPRRMSIRLEGREYDVEVEEIL